MTPIEALLKIKAMFQEAGELAPMPSEAPIEAPKEYVLKSGAKVKIDKLEVGGKVSIVDEAGNESPAPAGEHELADGSVIVLDESSTITEIKQPQAETPEVEVVIEQEEDKKDEEDPMAKKIAEMQKSLDDMKEEYGKKYKKMMESEAKFSEAISKLTDVVVGLCQTPSVEATETPKDKFNVHVESKQDKLARFLEFTKSIK